MNEEREQNERTVQKPLPGFEGSNVYKDLDIPHQDLNPQTDPSERDTEPVKTVTEEPDDFAKQEIKPQVPDYKTILEDKDERDKMYRRN